MPERVPISATAAPEYVEPKPQNREPQPVATSARPFVLPTRPSPEELDHEPAPATSPKPASAARQLTPEIASKR
jgi:hypothetical protein